MITLRALNKCKKEKKKRNRKCREVKSRIFFPVEAFLKKGQCWRGLVGLIGLKRCSVQSIVIMWDSNKIRGRDLLGGDGSALGRLHDSTHLSKKVNSLVRMARIGAGHYGMAETLLVPLLLFLSAVPMAPRYGHLRIFHLQIFLSINDLNKAYKLYAG